MARFLIVSSDSDNTNFIANYISANKSGKPFSFKLGPDVIKGWEIGLQGMRVGGERRITCPPSKAYGSKALPGIPANSTLIFDVKLLSVKSKK